MAVTESKFMQQDDVILRPVEKEDVVEAGDTL
jgi:hypothetical protein